MPVKMIASSFGRRLLRRVSQTWLIESLTARLRKPEIRRLMRDRCGDRETTALFHDVEIETVNRCNGRCTFCPVNASHDPRTMTTMDDGVFTGIVNELSAMQFQGQIGLSSNNEPFLDKDIIKRIAQCRAACPKARLYLYTNGTLLNGEKALLAIRAGLDQMVIDDYSENLVLSANVRQIIEVLDRPENAWAATKVVVALRKRDERLRNRAGRAPNKPCHIYRAFTNYADAGCTSPFTQIVIRPTGQVSLCCNDTRGEVTLGDVGKDGLLAVWNGPEFKRVRRLLLTEGRRKVELCASCDAVCFGFPETLRRLFRR